MTDNNQSESEDKSKKSEGFNPAILLIIPGFFVLYLIFKMIEWVQIENAKKNVKTMWSQPETQPTQPTPPETPSLTS